MSRYWSLEECCWVEYAGAPSVTSGSATTTRVEPDVDVSDQVPEQAAATPQRAPSLL